MHGGSEDHRREWAREGPGEPDPSQDTVQEPDRSISRHGFATVQEPDRSMSSMGLPPSSSSSSSRSERRTRKLLGRRAVEQEGKLLRKCGFEGSSSTERRREDEERLLGSGKWQEEDLTLCEKSKKLKVEEEEERVELLGLLPLHDLLIKILSFLPLPKLYELRLVCKSWNTLLRSPALLEAWSAEASSHEYWLVMARGLPSPRFAKEFIAYSPSLGGKRLRLPLDSPTISSYLGLSSTRVAAPQLPDELLTVSTCVAASAGGLICFVVNGPQHHFWDGFDIFDYTVLVLNVLTGAVRTLPPPPKHLGQLTRTDSLSISMSANSTTNSYLVVLHHILCPHLEIYDSKTGSWKVAQDITAAKCSGDVQSGDLFHFDFLPGTLSAYTIESDAWSKVRAPAPKVGSYSPTVIKYKGRVLYVNGLVKFETRPTKDLFPTIQGFGVWELQSSSTPGIANWVEVARTPPHCWKGFFDLVASSNLIYEIKFIFHESLICMTGVHHTDYNHGGKYFSPLVYDLVLDSWYHLPAYKGTLDFLGIFSFQPSFTAMV